MKPHFLFSLPASIRGRLLKFLFNCVPAFRGTGARVASIRPDLLGARLRLPFNWRTRNLVGSIFGGSIAAATDGTHATFLMFALGKNFVVWDKTLSVNFRKPARTTLYADIEISEREITEIRQEVAAKGEIRREFITPLVDAKGVVHSEITRTVYIADKNFYARKTAMRTSK